MAVTSMDNMQHKSQIYDGFATIRSTRSRVRLKNTAGVDCYSSSPSRNEYFTIRRNNKQTFLDNNNVARIAQHTPQSLDESVAHFAKANGIANEPIYAKISPPDSLESSPTKKKETDVHYDSINIKPLKNELHRKERYKQRTKDPTEVKVNPLIIIPKNDDLEFDKYTEIKQNGDVKSNDVLEDELEKKTFDTFRIDEKDLNTDTKESDDILEDILDKYSRFHRSPQKYATLNTRRPKTIELKPAYENPYYGSLNRSKVGHRSEPNTPLSIPTEEFVVNANETALPSPMELKNYDNFIYQKKNGVRRSNSELGSFYHNKLLNNTLPNFRHSVSVDVSSMSTTKNHVCCECITGISTNRAPALGAISRNSGFSQTLDTLYESQDPKVGCQTILRSKPPVPWWDLAIKKSRYQSCPILDEAHVVSAFEQSLSNMTQRLQQLTATAERKDSELTQLRQTIELLRKQSIQAGLTSAHMTSMGIKQDSVTDSPKQDNKQQTTASTNGMTRHHSTDSVSSLNSLSSGCSAQDKKQKKKGWLRSSFTKAFSRNAKISKTAKHSSLSHLSSSSQEHGSIGGDHQTIREGSNENSLENSHEVLMENLKGDKTNDKNDNSTANEGSIDAEGNRSDPQLVDELKKQLREKDLVLTDIRLEALSSAHQLESLKDTVIKMRNEMLNLKQNNERLQRLVRPRSLAGSHGSLSGTLPPGPAPSGNTPMGSSEDARRFSAADVQRSNNETHIDIHSQSLDLDFNCISSTPTMEYGSKIPSPNDRATSDLYRASQDLSLTALDEAELINGSPGIEDDPLLTGTRLSGVDCDISSVLPPPKCRELAMGETYADLGLNENSADVVDGKKIAISVYLGQPDTFTRYYEEMCESLNSCNSHYYSNRSSTNFSQDVNGSPRHNSVHSPDNENGEYHNKSNTNSLKSNKSSHSLAFKNNFNANDGTAINCNEFTIAYTYISGKTTWPNLDYTVRKTFKDYLSRIDPGTNLGLNTDSITSYHLGEALRGPEIGFPELLPCGYIIGTVRTLYICLQGVGSLAFDSLIPKNIVYRYVSLLSEHRRVILCGPSGTGKSYLAARLAEFHVARTASLINPAEAIATFNVEHKSSKELRQYLSNMAEQCGAEAVLPSVLILDNLHHASALADVFSGLLGARRTNLPCIIGTMSQATCNTTNLQLHHNFRWLLTANHMEPVKGFLARYLRRKQVMAELSGIQRCQRMATVLEWLPAIWQHVNSFLEAHSSSDVTVGPRLFLSCPLDLNASQAWFTNVWNQSVVPYLIEAAREGVALYGRRGPWADPVKHVKDTYPWPDQQPVQTLRGITLEDIGLDGNSSDTTATNNQDPLLNMLMRLREAASYSGNHSQDSDNASIDSNMTHDSSVGNEL